MKSIQMHEKEHVFSSSPGYLEIICGPMFSGKTEELIRKIRRFRYAKVKTVVFKPNIDTRHQKDLVISHSLQQVESISVDNIAAIRQYLAHIYSDAQVIAFDEVQFFSHEIVSFIEELVQKGKKVLAAGLTQDYLSRPFGPMPELLCQADFITKLLSICMRCGNLASKTHRRENNSSDQVLIGDCNQYEALCRSCYNSYFNQGNSHG